MNKDNAKDYLPLVQALANGKAIQYFPDESEGWIDCEDVNFMIDVSRFRIKPEPREIWVNRFPDGHEGYSWYETEEGAHRAYGRVGAIQVCYREVMK